MARWREERDATGGFSDDGSTTTSNSSSRSHSAARQGTLHAHHDGRVREIGEGEGAGRRDRGLRRTVSVHTAVGGGHADRSADVAADLEWRHAGGKGGRLHHRCFRPECESKIPRVVGPPVDPAIRLPVADCVGDVGLAEQARPGSEDSAGNRSVSLRAGTRSEVGSPRTEAGRPPASTPSRSWAGREVHFARLRRVLRRRASPPARARSGVRTGIALSTPSCLSIRAR